jgi:hypothetical protein
MNEGISTWEETIPRQAAGRNVPAFSSRDYGPADNHGAQMNGAVNLSQWCGVEISVDAG